MAGGSGKVEAGLWISCGKVVDNSLFFVENSAETVEFFGSFVDFWEASVDFSALLVEKSRLGCGFPVDFVGVFVKKFEGCGGKVVENFSVSTGGAMMTASR